MTDTREQTVQKTFFTQCAIVAAAFVLVFWPTLQEMYAIWMEDSNNSHGLLIPFIVGYLVWDIVKKQKDVLIPYGQAVKERDVFVAPAAIVFILTLVFYVAAVLMDIVFFKNLACVIAFQSLVLFLFGWAAIKPFVFPLFFMFFLIPIPTTVYGMVAMPMQLFATKLTVSIMGLTPLPIAADGNVIRVGDASLEVAEACSGLRSLFTFIVMSLLFAYLAKVKLWKKALMVCMSIPVAICGNMIRLIFTTFLAYIYGSKIASGFIHDVSGYVMFVIAFAVFMWLARALEDTEKKDVAA